MFVKAQIVMKYQTEQQAQIALKSLNPENENYIKSKIEGKQLNFDLSGESLRTFLATADDLIFCEMTVEKVLENTEES